MKKQWKITTHRLSPFELNDPIVELSDGSYGRLGMIPGKDETIPEKLFNAMPGWFEEVEEAPKYWPGRYKPELNETYYIIGEHCKMNKVVNKNMSLGEFHRATGVCSKTKKEAKFVLRQKAAYLELIDTIQEANKERAEDYIGKMEVKNYFVYHDKIDAISVKNEVGDEQSHPACEYMELLSSDSVIEELGKDKIKLALWSIE